MPRYAFHCVSKDHPKGVDRDFEVHLNLDPFKSKTVNRFKCHAEGCPAIAKRDMSKEIPTQVVIGATPISHSTTTKGSLSRELEFLAGRFKKNPDGTVDKNHRPFRDTGEMNKFMNGNNDLGKPSIDQRTGQPRRRKDGSIIREGAKLFKYGANATPSRSDVRRQRPRVPNAWTTEDRVKGGGGGISRQQLG